MIFMTPNPNHKPKTQIWNWKTKIQKGNEEWGDGCRKKV